MVILWSYTHKYMHMQYACMDGSPWLCGVFENTCVERTEMFNARSGFSTSF